MGIQIIDADVPLQVDAIIIAIYGIGGIGKTSLAFTANNPFLEDFDGGLQRSVKRKKAARFDAWEDAVDFHRSGQLKQMGIKTLVIDTVGTMLDNYVAAAVIKSDSKNGKKDGSLAIGGYGAMKNVFNQFVNQMKMEKIDIIFIAHDTDKEEGGYNKKTLKATGGSYDIIKSAADLIGYMTMENGKRILDFNTTDSYHCKNSAEFPKLFIPDYNATDYDGFMANIIQKCKDKMNTLSEEMVESQKRVDEFKQFIDEAESVEELIMLSDNIDEGLSKSYVVQVQKVYDDKFVNLFYKSIDAVKKAMDLEKQIAFATTQDKKYSNQMRASINKCLEANGWTYDKEAMQVVPVDPKTIKKEESTDNKPDDINVEAPAGEKKTPAKANTKKKTEAVQQEIKA